MNNHSIETNGFTLDLHDSANESRILNSTTVFQETIDFAIRVLPLIARHQKATLKRTIPYLKSLRERQIELFEKMMSGFRAESERLDNYLKNRNHGSR